MKKSIKQNLIIQEKPEKQSQRLAVIKLHNEPLEITK